MDSREKKQLVVLGVLSLVLVGMIYMFYLRPSGSKPRSAGRASAAAHQTQAAQPLRGALAGQSLDVVDDLLVHAQVTLDAPAQNVMDVGGRNLFRFSKPEPEPAAESQQQVASSDLPLWAPDELTAIIWSPDKPVALLDGILVGVGDVVGRGAQVHAIEPTRVTVEITYGGQTGLVHVDLLPGS